MFISCSSKTRRVGLTRCLCRDANRRLDIPKLNMLKAYLIEIAIILIAIWLVKVGGWVRHKHSARAREASDKARR